MKQGEAHFQNKVPLVSVVIVNYNGEQFLDGCIKSIERHLGDSAEIVVVDNASADDSTSFIQNNFPGVILIESSENVGFGQGNNLGVKRASGKFILLLNNDAKLLSPLDRALEIFEQDQSVGIVGAKMLGKDLEYRLSCGYFPRWFRLFLLRTLFVRKGQFRNGDFDEDDTRFYPVDWVEGSFMLTTRPLWEEIGGFDPAYFMYVEDVDLCRKMMNRNYRTVYFPYVAYQHYGGYNAGRYFWLIESFRAYHEIHSGTVERVFASCIIYLRGTARFLIQKVKVLVARITKG